MDLFHVFDQKLYLGYVWPVVWCVLYVLWVLEKNGYSAVGWCVLFCKCGLNSFGDCVDRGVEINHVASTDTVKG